MHPDLLIRSVLPDDAEAIVNILNPIIAAGTYTALDLPLSVAAEREFITRFPERGIFHVAVRPQEGRIAGLQNVEPFATYTRGFDHVGIVGTFVDLALRQQGIGRCLFETTYLAAQDKGYEKLLAYIRADNPGALISYLRQGFSIVGTTRKQLKIRGVYVDEIIAEKML